LFIKREVGLGVEQRQRVLHPLAIALLVTGEHGVGGLDVAGADHVVETQPIGFELGDVAGEKITALPIHAVEKLVHHPRRDRIVDLEAAVVRVLEQ
jgi:hypothetical protein